jgi:transposase-like protein
MQEINAIIQANGVTRTCLCGSKHIVKAGKQITRKGKKQRYLCCICGRILLE